MKKLLEALSKPLAKEDVELRVGQVTDKGFSLLLYKTARVDVKRLNDSGAIWKNEHKFDDSGNLKCVISVYDAEHNLWIPREDIGRESNTEAEKGNYSDSFKRAGFRWGIGLELYNAPFIWVTAFEITEFKGKKKPKNFFDSDLTITEYEVKDGHFTKLTIEYKGKGVVFSMDKSKVTKQAPRANQSQKQAPKQEPANNQKQETILELASEDDILTIESLIASTNSDKEKFLKAFHIDCLENMPKAHVEKAIELLTSKTRKAS